MDIYVNIKIILMGLQEIYSSSGKMFRLTEKSDPINLIAWFLNELNSSLSKKTPRVGR